VSRPGGRFITASAASSLGFDADRARQRETKAEIRENEHCNWRRTGRGWRRGLGQREEHTEKIIAKESKKRRPWIRDLHSTPARERSVRERAGTDPALLLRDDPGWSPRPAQTSPAVKRSDKAAMFICKDRGKEKRERGV